MTPLPRLVATDLDGTLVRSDGSLSERTRSVLLRAEDAGVVVVFVTGRPLRWAREVFAHVGSHGLAIVSNGALVWDVAADRPQLVRGIEPSVGLEAASLIRDAIPGTAYAVETLDGIGLEPAFLERHPVPRGARRGELAEIFEQAGLKILARHEELGAQEFWDRARTAAGDRLEITWSSPTSMLEMSAAGVTKATTLAVLAEQHDLGPADVVAFGDMPNDIPLLEWAGTSYAMANAHPTVIAAADHVAPTNDDDGVAQVLEQLLGG